MKITFEDLITGAKTIYGEARGESKGGKAAVACVLRNRLMKQWRGKKTLTDVCLDRWQFSCWNEQDPNSTMLKTNKFDIFDPGFWNCVDSMRYALMQPSFDPTEGATHYHTVRVTPSWSKGKKPCYAIGNHVFYNNID